MNLAVIIVNFNSGKLLSQCLEHLARQTRPPNQIVVVDNGSDDESLQDLPSLDACKIVELGENTGFATANNRALQLLEQADLVVTLNPDAFPDPEFIAQLELAANSYPQYASFACRMMKNSETLDGAGDAYHISGFVWRHQHGRPYSRQNEKPYEVFSACAGAAMYRAEVLREVGGFDESFFCYVEDVDLGYRLRLRGEHCLYIPSAVAMHLGSAISNAYPGFALYHGHRNLVWTFVKNTPTGLLLLMLPLHLLTTILAALLYTFRGQLWTFTRAKRDALRGLGAVLRQRASIQANTKISSWALLRTFDYSLIPRRKPSKLVSPGE